NGKPHEKKAVLANFHSTLMVRSRPTYAKRHSPVPSAAESARRGAASMVNQKTTDLGLPNRTNLKSSCFRVVLTVSTQVDVIAVAGTLAPLAAKRATATTPIVCGRAVQDDGRRRYGPRALSWGRAGVQ